MISIFKIYVLQDPVTWEIRYVGCTRQSLSVRLKQHLKDRCFCHRTCWIKKLASQNLKPNILLVAIVGNDKWVEAERFWIKYFKDSGCRLVNGTDGGEGTPGHVCGDTTRGKLRSAALRQMSDPEMRKSVSLVHKGKTISAEHRKVVGVAAKKKWEQFRREGRSMSLESRIKMSEAKKGRRNSDEARRKMSLALRGKSKSPEHRAKLAEHCRRLNVIRWGNKNKVEIPLEKES